MRRRKKGKGNSGKEESREGPCTDIIEEQREAGGRGGRKRRTANMPEICQVEWTVEGEGREGGILEFLHPPSQRAAFFGRGKMRAAAIQTAWARGVERRFTVPGKSGERT